MKNNESGFTLIELLIVIVISALLTGAIYATFMSQQRSYAIQTGVTDMQQNARAALSLMERDLRMAGFGVGDSVTVNDYWGNPINSAITITDGGTGKVTDGIPEITVVYAAQQVSTVQSVTDTLVRLDDAGTLTTGQYIAFETMRGVYQIQSRNGNKLTLSSAPLAYVANLRSSEAPSGAKAYLVKVITYQVDQTRNPPILERVDSTDTTAPDAEDLWDDIANYITGLQVVYPFDPGTGPDNNLLQVTLTSQYQDHEGITRTRQHQAVINIRNNGL